MDQQMEKNLEHEQSYSLNSSYSPETPTYTPKVFRIMAFWALFRGLGLLFYLLLGSRYSSSCNGLRDGR